MDSFNAFREAHTCKDTLTAFHEVKEQFGLLQTPQEQFFEQLKYGLKKSNAWHVKKFLQDLEKRCDWKEYEETKKDDRHKILVIGAGPCGLRLAIEAAFMGCNVTLVDKRTGFSRNNVLHLWPFTVTDLKSIGIKFFFARFCCGELDHISIRRLQLSLLKIALVLGVHINMGVEFTGLRLPSNQTGSGWRCICKPESTIVNVSTFNVLVAATGSRDVLCEFDMFDDNNMKITRQGFERKEFRGKLSIAITANFVNTNTPAEMKIKEMGGVAAHFNPKFFKDLRQKGIHLENMVYFRDETHYFVMTAKKESLLKRGVLKENFNDPSELLEKRNIDVKKLKEYTRDAANYCTNNALSKIGFAQNFAGIDDVTMFDFSTKLESVNSSRVIERNGKQLLLCLVGDSLLEPFWPQGTGCARGFLGALDAAWMISNFQKEKPLDVIAERESVYKILSTTTADNIRKEYSKYTIDPRTRYKSVNMKSVRPKDAEQFYDVLEDNVSELDAAQAKKSKLGEDIVDLKEVLEWCQLVLNRHKKIQINNLGSSWRSGYELGVLIFTFQPNVIQLKDLDLASSYHTMTIVVNIAERELGIFPPLSIAEMISCSTDDEVKMAFYITQFYNLFKEYGIPKTASEEQTKENIYRGDDIEMDGQDDSIQNQSKDTIDDIDLDVNLSQTKEKQAELDKEKEKKFLTNDMDVSDHNETPPAVKPRISRDLQEKSESRSNICYVCKRVLFVLEKVNVEDVFCHRACLQCKRCGCDLNLNDYRIVKSPNGEKLFYCPKHAGPGSKFTQSIRKSPKRFGLKKEKINDKPENVKIDMSEVPPPVPKRKPKIPPRPDFLARRVTPGSIRRAEFYNTPEDNESGVSEDKIFEHNFGSSVRRGLGTFSIFKPEEEEEQQPSSDSDSNDNIGEQLETTIGMNMDLSKNLTIKDAKVLWSTLKRGTSYQMNVIRHLEQESSTEANNESVNNGSKLSLEDTTIQEEDEDENDEDHNVTIRNPSSNKDNPFKAKDATNISGRISVGSTTRFENAVKELNRESQEFSDKQYNFSATSYRPNKPNRQGIQSSDNEAKLRRQRLRRCDSDETDIRHAQRVQLAARKLVIQRQQAQISDMQEIKRQLEEAEQAIQEVEQEGVEVEKALKENKDTTEEDKPELKRKLCSLYCRRLKLLEYEAELRTANEKYTNTVKEKEGRSIQVISNPMHHSSDEDENTTDSIRPVNRSLKLDKENCGMKQPQSSELNTGLKPVDTTHVDALTYNEDQVRNLYPDLTKLVANDHVISQSNNDNPDPAHQHSQNNSASGEMEIANHSENPRRLVNENATIALSIGEAIINFESDVDRTIMIPTLDQTRKLKFVEALDPHDKISPRSTDSSDNSSNNEGDKLPDQFFENLTIKEEGSEEDYWECPFCTLHNKEQDTFCDACNAWKCSLCTLVNAIRKKKCDACFTDRPSRGGDEQSAHSRQSTA